MQADLDKLISAIAPPQSKAGLQRFVGMANYLPPYSPNLSTVIRPFQQLTQSDTLFMWHKHRTTHLRKANTSFPPHQCSIIMALTNW